jgi:hypothetical protein
MLCASEDASFLGPAHCFVAALPDCALFGAVLDGDVHTVACSRSTVLVPMSRPRVALCVDIE